MNVVRDTQRALELTQAIQANLSSSCAETSISLAVNALDNALRVLTREEDEAHAQSLSDYRGQVA